MKIVIINGSARKGNTLTAINAFIKGASEKNEIEIIEPDKLNIAPCKGCGVCQCSKGCVDKDDTNPTIDKIAAADMILFATPVYWWGMSAQLKLIIDKCYCRGLQLKNKKVGTIVVGGSPVDSIQYELIDKQFDCMAKYLSWIVAPLEGYLLPDYMIAGTGSIIADSHQQILHEEPVSFTAIKKIINEYASDIPLTVHTKDNVFSCNQKKQYNLPTTPISSIDLLKTEKLYGMSFHFKDNKSAKAFADWLEKSDHQEVRAFVNIQDVDMACRDCSKGNAMNILCQKLGFMHEQIYAIGDAENDIDMLRATSNNQKAQLSVSECEFYSGQNSALCVLFASFLAALFTFFYRRF